MKIFRVSFYISSERNIKKSLLFSLLKNELYDSPAYKYLIHAFLENSPQDSWEEKKASEIKP